MVVSAKCPDDIYARLANFKVLAQKFDGRSKAKRDYVDMADKLTNFIW